MEAGMTVEEARHSSGIAAAIDDAEDLQIAVLEHGAVIARAEILHRSAGNKLPLMQALRGQEEAEIGVAPRRPREIRHHHRHVIELEFEFWPAHVDSPSTGPKAAVRIRATSRRSILAA